MGEVLDAPAISSWQLHNLSFQPSFRSITCNRLTAGTWYGLIIGTDPRRQAQVGHFSCDIAEYRSNELVMKMVSLAIGVGEDRVYPF